MPVLKSWWKMGSPGLQVGLGFGALIVAFALVGWWVSHAPVNDEMCQRRCAAHGRVGQMVWLVPPAQRQPGKSGQARCQCSAPGQQGVLPQRQPVSQTPQR